jgi:hypothetical protein
MKTATFPALCFLTLAYCAGFVIIALVLVVIRSMPKNRPSIGINAQTLAPIFEPVPLIDAVTNATQSPSEVVDVPISNRRCQNLSYKCNSVGKKPKANISALIREEFGAASCEPR